MPEGHYFDSEPAVASNTRTVPLVLPDLSVTLTTDRGVFARGAVDPGTKLLLLEGPSIRNSGERLDEGLWSHPDARAAP